MKESSPSVRLRDSILACLLVAASTFGTAALATPPVGVLQAPVVARGSFTNSTDVKFKIKDGKEEVIQVSGTRQTLVQQILISPGGTFGWHSHPGPVVVVVQKGELTFYDGDDPTCTAVVYRKGDVFIDRGQGHVHFAANASATTDLELWATYFDVPVGAAQRIDAPSPGNCPF